MVTHAIDYKQVIDLGFVREEHPDQIWFNQKGYGYFLVTKKLAKGIYLDWDTEERTVSLVRWKPKTGDILGRMPLFSMDEIKETIEFYKKK